VTAPQLLAAGDATSTSASVTFWVLAVVSVAAGLGMVLARRAVHCAVLLAVVMLSLAILYAAAGAPFLAFVQIIVYTGAVLMLFLFVLMIVGVSSADSTRETIRGQRLAAGVAGIALLVLLSLVVGHAAIGPAATAGAGYGTANLQTLARLIFTRYVYAFEVTSALLITAALGAMVLAHRERTTPKPTQAELASQRVAGGHPTPLPGPGVYARHNAVDMPALLPDGTPSRLSVSPVIALAGIERREPAGSAARLPSGGGEEAAQSGGGSGAHAETDSSPADSGSSPADSGSGAAGNGAGAAHEEGRS
jgi:NADH-quinone oxidoreductase subunit J